MNDHRCAPRLSSPNVTRRDFIAKTALASAAAVLGGGALARAAVKPLPMIVFSKVYQELKLSFDEAASVTAEAGLDGIDCPVRPGGEVLPERVSEDLPRYVEALHSKKLQLPYVTTAITSTASPQAETILRVAKRLGVQAYRLGFMERQADVPLEKQLSEIKARLKDLTAISQAIGIGALLQNHSPSGHTYIGGDLSELYELVDGFEPAQLGVAFDIGHAIIVHGDQWRPWFEKLKSHLKIAYIKDAKREGGWVPFGQGDIAATGYFKLLKESGYSSPIEIHLEYDWTDHGKSKDRATLVKTLKDSARVTRRWLAEA